MTKRNIILGVCAADLLAAVIMLIVIAEKPVSSIAVTMPAMLIMFGVLLFGQKNTALKGFEYFLPAVCGLILNTNKIKEKICAEIQYIRDCRLEFF